MKVIILGSGTSQGVPVIACQCQVCNSLDFRDKRLRVSIYIEIDDLKLVVDTGPDFRMQMLKNNIKSLDAVLFTHEHKDHTAGMDDLRSFHFRSKKDMPIYARESVLEQLKQEFSYIFVPAEKKYPGVLTVEEHLIYNQNFTIKNTTILPIEGLHHRLKVFGFRIKDFVYLTDVNHIPDAEKHKLYNLEVLIIGALQHEPHISHYSLEEALAVVKEFQPKKAYFTHISHHLGKHADIEKILPENVFLAYDGLKLEL